MVGEIQLSMLVQIYLITLKFSQGAHYVQLLSNQPYVTDQHITAMNFEELKYKVVVYKINVSVSSACAISDFKYLNEGNSMCLCITLLVVFLTG